MIYTWMAILKVILVTLIPALAILTRINQEIIRRGLGIRQFDLYITWTRTKVEVMRNVLYSSPLKCSGFQQTYFS